MPAATGTKLVFVLTALAQLTEATTFEKRLAELEEKADALTTKRPLALVARET